MVSVLTLAGESLHFDAEEVMLGSSVGHQKLESCRRGMTGGLKPNINDINIYIYIMVTSSYLNFEGLRLANLQEVHADQPHRQSSFQTHMGL